MTPPSLRFLGAARNVTGSRYLVETDGSRVLVDCGLYQEREFAARNWEPFPVDPASLDAVLLTHAHLDHSGYLPRLVRDGFRGPVYCTPATADILAILLEDSARIQEEDAATKKRRHAREGRSGPHPEAPLYTVEDALRALSQVRRVEYGERLSITPAVACTWHDAGHILGSASLVVEAGEGPARRRVLFSGDLGRVARPLLHDPDTHEMADYLVIESTYGDRLHPSDGGAPEQLARIINEAAEEGGVVLIPSFAIERAQELLWMLRSLMDAGRIPPLLCFMDSPMATDVTRVFERYPELLDPELEALLEAGDSPFRFPGLAFTRTVNESKALNRLRGTAVIIAGSGMCTGGRIKHHLSNHIGDPHSRVVFVGYQAHGTLGRAIVEGADPVRILGRPHAVRARIEQVSGLSAHADHDGLMNWAQELDAAPRRVLVTHGEEETALAFAQELGERTGWPTHAPEYGEAVVLA
jgi:metallo-beta-lactamase family protein